VTFNEDSTFHFDKAVPFIFDSSGTWTVARGWSSANLNFYIIEENISFKEQIVLGTWIISEGWLSKGWD
jgi:hypothetical protein